MKKITLIAAAAVAALLLTAGAGRAELTIQPGGSLYIEGDSTLHVWRSTAATLSLTFQTAEGSPADIGAAIKAAQVKGLEARIPLAGMKSGESRLDKNMRAAMSADKYPEIVYRLGRYELAKSDDASVLAAKTEGELTIRGKTRPARMDVEFRFGPAGVELRGSHTLLMSDFGVAPPSLMFGAIKVKDPVTVRFDLFLSDQAHP